MTPPVGPGPVPPGTGPDRPGARWATGTRRRGRAVPTAGHLLLGLPLGLAWTTTLGGALVLGVVAFPLGLPVAGFGLLLAQLGAEIERDRAVAVLGERPTRSEPIPTTGRLHRRVLAAARSRTTWREVAYLLTFGPLLAVLAVLAVGAVAATLAAATSGWWLPAGPVEAFGTDVPRPLVGVLLATTAVGLLVAAPTIGRAVLAVHRAHLELLAPSSDHLRGRVAEAERRRHLLEQAAANERARIERDLHDGLQPLLVTASVTISSARRALGADLELADERLAEVQQQLRQAMGDVRDLVQGLAPRSLHEAGLDEALGELVAGLPVATALDVALDGPLDDTTAAVAYFVASEGVTNAVRHAEASRIEVVVSGDADGVDVVVRDDGRGDARPRCGGGLEGLDARVAAAGGLLTVGPGDRSGTVVAARLPRPVADLASDGSAPGSPVGTGASGPGGGR